MPNETLIARLEQSLRQSRAARTRLAARLAELESEGEMIRAELGEMDTLAGQTEAAIIRLLSNVVTGPSTQVGTTSVGELEVELQRRLARVELAQRPHASTKHIVPALRDNIEAIDDRFFDRTIPQATTMILREAGGPLHVNEIYNRLMEGGFSFTGNNPTISIAVSLNRNSRFRKVAPGTFDLVIRDAAKAS
ncbi:MAG TPA: winged helix-turn-helix domain-containing protein [Pyrinomonadaceae bacterium]|nr:winged helix-turn-helix domain-containing protein [Pyrinomonadaceae bacterium]